MLAIDGLRFYRAHASLRDGTPVCIRAIRPDDKDRLAGHFERLSSQSRYRRFLGFRKALTSQELRFFTEPDFVGQVALVATIIYEGGGLESIVADGRYVAVAGCQDAAELALSVVDDYQRKGIGTLLLRHLIRLARCAGLRRLQADVLGSNRTALRFLLRSGGKSSVTSAGVCRVTLSIEDHDGEPSLTAGQPTLSTIRQCAYKLYLGGGGHGKDFEDWLAAEHLLRAVSSSNWPGRRLGDDEEIPAGE